MNPLWSPNNKFIFLKIKDKQLDLYLGIVFVSLLQIQFTIKKKWLVFDRILYWKRVSRFEYGHFTSTNLLISWHCHENIPSGDALI